MVFRDKVVAAYQKIQDEICSSLELADGKAKFEQEIWEREGGGGGRTRIMQHGNVIEKGGVNFSAVHGKLPDAVKKAFKVENDDFFATGVSIVMHPSNPHVPIIHMNIRYFEMDEQTRWFGGGIDLTPHYLIDTDVRFFHHLLKQTCDLFDPAFYTKFKENADDYFFIKHREETRGVGGIFYDRLKPENTGLTFDQLLDFSIAVGNTFIPAYTELIERNRDKEFTAQQQEWQYLRRSRYAEFNLVYDAGTKFGLETNGRIESILMSLPPMAKWTYNYQALPGSPEAYTLSMLKKGIIWA
ncbi:oxygen-dependent coproporphyrinogen oxidase [Pedobacter heparinus]|uniref:coproporphyrinogen oxidase n=1 Tax=Pedobacter heparinus (strain ATCC 13125 / DSM 2366 / CIP 104194 / JCM 7457 / NBRC 12017 / NCIMB 9290 / NRRL B-14731 / HIM 762-3) TaxID=485917 RepID=C6XXU8_PEDHD|nr:oxygen-dependent coproporphyrinogen oxidase [Pedobacter heparinus]ACU04366.1 Coproporphyrinogen oxidase [Pedobacter heparinus DSM 2366]